MASRTGFLRALSLARSRAAADLQEVTGWRTAPRWQAAGWPRVLGAAALAAGLTAGLSGCQSIDMSAANTAQLRVIYASPDAPGIDAYQNGSALAYSLSFGAMTSYVPMTPGSYTLAANRAGTRQALISETASLAAGRQYTMIVGNIAAAMQQTLLVDQSQPAPAGQIAVRLVNQATRAGAVDVYMVSANGKLATSLPVTTSLPFGAYTAYLNLPAGTYALAVVPAGTVPTSNTATLLSGAQVEYSSGSVRTIVLIDHPVATVPGVQAIMAEDVEAP